jgi:hypothetical protein
MFSMDQSRPARETCRQHCIESGPVSRVNDVDVRPLEKPAQPDHCSHIVTVSLVHLVIYDRPPETLEEFTAVSQEAQFVNQVNRRMVDQIDDPVFKTAR